MWEGVSPSHNGDFLNFGGIKTRFQCIIKLKLTSILAPNVYDWSTGGWGPFLLKGMGRVWEGGPSHGWDFLEIRVLNPGVLCNIKFKLTSIL